MSARVMDRAHDGPWPAESARFAVPAVRVLAIGRPRLFEGPLAPLTLVGAPAGYGKTTAVAQWVGSMPGAVRWVVPEPERTSPEDLWRLLMDGIVEDVLDRVRRPGERRLLIAAALCPRMKASSIVEIIDRLPDGQEQDRQAREARGLRSTQRLRDFGVLVRTPPLDVLRVGSHPGLTAELRRRAPEELSTDEILTLRRRHALELEDFDPVAALAAHCELGDYASARLAGRATLPRAHRPGEPDRGAPVGHPRGVCGRAARAQRAAGPSRLRGRLAQRRGIRDAGRPPPRHRPRQDPHRRPGDPA